jgi:Dolichyl-phosphate-mannose-protein mannosyltransferase
MITLVRQKSSLVIVFFLSAIMVGAALLRFWNLGEIGLGGDESVYAAQALILAGHNELQEYFVLISRGLTNFLLNQAIQSIFYTVAGFSEFSTRFLSAALSVGTCVLVFFLGRDMYNKWTGLISALLLSIHAYSVALGRQGYLDSTMVFFFTLSIFMLYKWIKTGDPKWSYILAATSAAAILTKVPAMILIPIIMTTLLLVSRGFRPINVRTLTIFVLIFFAGLSPAFIQIAMNFDTYLSFLGGGGSRIINVPITFYFEKLLSHSGPFFMASAFFGILISFVRRTKADLLCIVWLVITVVYLQLIPIKAWNYCLPLVPLLSIFAARGITLLLALLPPLLANRKNNKNARQQISPIRLTTISGGLIGIFLLLSVTYTEIYVSVESILYDRPFVGLKEASYWIAENGIPNATVMTPSQGSAQYVFSLYGHIDTYPFGNFKLHTLLPNGDLIVGAPPPDPLIQDGTIDYLVHYISNTDAGDDPFHMENKTKLQSKFLDLVRKYDSELRYIYYDKYVTLNGSEVTEPRVWVFEVGKRMPDMSRSVEYNEVGYGVNEVGHGVNEVGHGVNAKPN